MTFKHIPKSVHLLAIIIAISLLPINSEANRGAYMSNEIIYDKGSTLLANNWRQLIVKRISTVLPVPASRTWQDVKGRELSGEFLKFYEFIPLVANLAICRGSERCIPLLGHPKLTGDQITREHPTIYSCDRERRKGCINCFQNEGGGSPLTTPYSSGHFPFGHL
jgi:hypothetical protein